MKSLTLTIYGDLMSKSNSRIMTSFRGRPRLIKKPKALKYEADAIVQIQSRLGRSRTLEDMFTEPVVLDATIYYSSKRPDLDVSLLMDVLEKSGVYKNDRQVYQINARKRFDKENPRVIVKISELEEDHP